MTSYRLVLFVHILLAVILYGAGTVTHLGLLQLRRAADVATVRSWAAILRRVEPVFPLGALLLFLAGAYLVHEGFSWRDGWVVASVAGLAAVEVVGGTAARAGGKALHTALEGVPDGPLPPALRAAVLNRGLWLSTHTITGLVTGILFLMAVKPGGAAALLVLLVAGLLGMASALPLLKPAPDAALAPGPRR